MILDLEIVRARCSPAPDLDVVDFRLAEWHAVLRQIRNDRNKGVEGFQHIAETNFIGLQLFFQRSDFGQDGRSILTLALEHADLFRQTVAAGLQVLSARLQRLAFGFKLLEGSYVKRIAAGGQTFGNCIDVVAQ